MKTQIKTSKLHIKLLVKYSFLMCLILFISQCGPSKNTTSANRSVIGKSNFIFIGTILKMNASNINLGTENPSAIVKVDEVIDAVPPYEQMKGKEITVLLTSDKNRKTGSKEVFYTVGWYYGKTLGVKEIPNNLSKEIQPDLKQSIAQERINIKNDSLRVELNKARLVIQGVVTDAGIKDEKYPPIGTEHDPYFEKAVIEIKDILKGDTTQKHVEVYYASSDDVMWYSAPKLQKGQEGIFLLQVNQAPAMFKMRNYTILDSRDFQPTEKLADIKSLLK